MAVVPMSDRCALANHVGDRPAHAFAMLDGFRGVGCLIVVAAHCPEYVRPIAFPSGSIVVDAFFFMSGFVIAHAYWDALSSGAMTRMKFATTRLIRLYPLYLLGVLLGAPAFYATWMAFDGRYVDASTWLREFTLNAVMLPNLSGPFREVVPANMPGWSLILEVAANMAFVLVFPLLNARVLAAITAIGAVLLTFSIATHGNGDMGSDAWDFFQGGARMLYSFPLGVLTFLVCKRGIVLGPRAAWATRFLRKLRPQPLPLIVLLVFMLTFRVEGVWRILYDVVGVLFVMPAFIMLCSACRPRGVTAIVFQFLGRISFAVYALHFTIIGMFRVFVPADPAGLADARTLVAALAILALSIVFAWIATDYIDEPIRRFLRRATDNVSLPRLRRL